MHQEAVLCCAELLGFRPGPGRLLHPVAGVAVCVPALTHTHNSKLFFKNASKCIGFDYLMAFLPTAGHPYWVGATEGTG